MRLALTTKREVVPEISLSVAASLYIIIFAVIRLFLSCVNSLVREIMNNVDSKVQL